MRRAVPPTALSLLPLRRSQRPRPSRSDRSCCLCSAHPGRACTCTPPHRVHIVWHMNAISTRSLHRTGCCLQPAVVESSDARMSTSIEQLPQPAAPPHPIPPARVLVLIRPLHGPKRFRGVSFCFRSKTTPDGRGRSHRHRLAPTTSCSRKPFGAAISIRSHDYCGNARTSHRRRFAVLTCTTATRY